MATDGIKVSNTEITQTFDVWRRNTNDAADRLNSITTSFMNNRITLTGNVEVGTSNFVVDSGTNRVGVGTATPAVKLDVDGETNISEDLKVGISGGGTANLIVDVSTNRVGINTNAPTEALDVTGKTLISDDLMVSGAVSNVLFVDTSGTSVGINVDAPTASSLEISGDVLLQNTDELKIKNNGGTSQTVLTVNASDSTILQGSGGTESVAIKSSDGTSRITITEAGVTAFSANVSIPDNEILSIGDSNDLIFYHDATNSYVQSATGSLNIQTTSANSIVVEQGGAVTLYFSDAPNNVKLVTTTDGVDITGELQSDSLDVDGVADILGATTLQSTLQVDGIATFNNNVSLQDNDSLLIGTDDDLHFYHDASDSYIKEQGKGDLYIQSTAGAIRLQTNTSENSIVAAQDGAVDLYHNNDLRLSTTASGVNVPQTLTAAGLDINGTADISQGVTLNSSSGTTTIQGATTINDTLAINDTLDVTGITTLSNDLLVSTASNASNTLFVDVSTQRVGINNDSPTQALDIAGNIDLTGIIKATNENPGYFLTLDTGGTSMSYVDITNVLASNGTVSKPLNAPYPNAIGTERDVATWSSNTVITGNTNMLTYDTAAGQLNIKSNDLVSGSATLSLQDLASGHSAELVNDGANLKIRSGSGSGSILFSGATDTTNIGSFQVRSGDADQDIYHTGNLEVTEFSRLVATTASSTDNYYSKIVEWQGTGTYQSASLVLLIKSDRSTSTTDYIGSCSAIVSVTFSQNQSTGDETESDIQILSYSSHGTGTTADIIQSLILNDIGFSTINPQELWIRAGASNQVFTVYVLTQRVEGGTLTFNDSSSWQVGAPSSTKTVTAIEQSKNLLPKLDGTYDLGSNSIRWANVYGDTLYGNLAATSQIPAGNLDSDVLPYAGASSSSSNYKVAFLDSTTTTAGNFGLLKDDGANEFTYNPSSNILTAGNFNGNISVDNETTSGSTHYITFTDTTSGTQSRLHEDSGLTYVPSTGTLTAAAFSGDGSSITNINATDVGGLNNNIVVITDAAGGDLTSSAVTADELNVLDGGTSATATTVVGADRVVFNDAGTMKQVAMTDLHDYFDSTNHTITGQKTFGSGSLLKFNDNVELQMGTGSGGDFVIDFNTNDLVIHQNVSTLHDILITDVDGTKFNFDISAGDLAATTFTGDLVGNADTATDLSRSVIAGDGLTGGGQLNTNQTLAVDTTVVRTTGTQTITGNKTFSNTIDFNGTARLNDNVELEFGTGGTSDAYMYWSGTGLYLESTSDVYFDFNGTGTTDNFIIRDGSTERMRLDATTGDLTLATGDLVLTSGSLVGDSDIPRISTDFTVTLNIKNSVGATQKTLKSIP